MLTKIMAVIGKQENGNFIHIFGEVLAQNWDFEFGKGLLFSPKIRPRKIPELSFHARIIK